MILGVTGHRPPKVGGYHVPNPIFDRIGAALREHLTALKNTRTLEYVLTGMALGVDQWAAWLCIDLEIPFWAVVPCANFSDRWPPTAQEEYRFLLNRAARVVNVSSEPYREGCLMRRNKWLVDNSHRMLAVWNGEQEGGTWSTLRYATQHGSPINYVDLSDEFWAEVREQQGLPPIRQRTLPGMPRPNRFMQEVQAEMVRNMDQVRAARLEPYNAPYTVSDAEASLRASNELAALEREARRQQEEMMNSVRDDLDRTILSAYAVPEEMLRPQGTTTGRMSSSTPSQQNVPRQIPTPEEMQSLSELYERTQRNNNRELSRQRGIERLRRAAEDQHRRDLNQVDSFRLAIAPMTRMEVIPRPTAPEPPKPETINTEDRFKPGRFVVIDDEDT